jgi:ankyrin repeat protein
MIHIPFDILHLIFTFISFCNKNWLNIKLSSKLFKNIGDRAFIPTYVHFQTALKDKNIFSLKKLLSYSNVDLYHCNNDVISSAIRKACYFGHNEILKLLLQDHRVDPSANDNEAIQNACYYKQNDVVKLLLQDPRVDSSVSNNILIQNACYKGNIDLVKLLLQDPRVDPSVQNNEVFQRACSSGDIKVMKLLLKDSRVA